MAVYPPRHQTADKTVRVDLSHASDVFLVDQTNYNLYCRGSGFNYHGGHYKNTPVLLSIPRSETWYLVVDGARKASVQVLG